MFTSDISNSGALPVLKAAVRFSAARTPLLVNNIANASTPDYRPVDVAPASFQRALRDAVKERRSRNGGERGELEMRSSREIGVGRDGSLSLTPRQTGRNVLFHDRNDRDLERMMQDLVENAAAHRVATDLLKSRYELIRAAISERVS